MKLSLSVRIAESSSRKDRAEMPLDQLAPLAKASAFDGLSMRASAVSVDTPSERVAQIRALLDRTGLAVSMVMGNVALATNSADAPEVLGKITPHLDLAERLGSRLVRVMLQTPGDIPAARRAADEAAERGIAIAQQTHWGTLCETVEQCCEVVDAVGRPNFGITFEPANLLACGEDVGATAIAAAVARIAPHIFNVYFQNLRLDPAGAHRFPTRRRGVVQIQYLPLDDTRGIPVHPLIDALTKVGYDGWFTVHQPLLDGQTVPDAIAEAARVFRPLIPGTASR